MRTSCFRRRAASLRPLRTWQQSRSQHEAAEQLLDWGVMITGKAMLGTYTTWPRVYIAATYAWRPIPTLRPYDRQHWTPMLNVSGVPLRLYRLICLGAISSCRRGISRAGPDLGYP